MLSQQKRLPNNLLWAALFLNITLDIQLTVYQEHFVHKLDHQVRI